MRARTHTHTHTTHKHIHTHRHTDRDTHAHPHPHTACHSPTSPDSHRHTDTQTQSQTQTHTHTYTHTACYSPRAPLHDIQVIQRHRIHTHAPVLLQPHVREHIFQRCTPHKETRHALLPPPPRSPPLNANPRHKQHAPTGARQSPAVARAVVDTCTRNMMRNNIRHPAAVRVRVRARTFRRGLTVGGSKQRRLVLRREGSTPPSPFPGAKGFSMACASETCWRSN